MRFEGIVKSWNDERGFGFIEPLQGGQEIFVHIKAFRARRGRPQPGQPLTFEIELNAQGKKRASKVELVRPAHARPRRPGAPAQWGAASCIAVPAFLVVYAAVAAVWRVPAWWAALYAIASVVCFMAYAIDKSAAVAGRWRVSESTLLALGLAGGWPGAIAAQRWLRHKSSKASFRSVFWGGVVVNVLAFVAINSPLLSSLRA